MSIPLPPQAAGPCLPGLYGQMDYIEYAGHLGDWKRKWKLLYMVIGYKAGFNMENGHSNGDYYIIIGFT